MAETLRASDRGLETIEQAMWRKGWTKTRTPLWWEEAYTTQATIRRFWRRIPIQPESFIGICQAVGIEDWQAIVDLDVLPKSPLSPRQDWGEAPDISSFYGRATELDCLERLIVSQRCKLVAVLGIGGIGKTSLAVRLVDQIQDKFDCLIWKSLLGTPPLPQLLESLIQFLSDGRETLESKDIQVGISQLMGHLQQQRCLLVFDEVEAILGSREGKSRRRTIGQYLKGYEGYGNLFKRMGSDRHQSCLLLTCREKLGEIAAYEGETLPVRSVQLQGLDAESAQKLFVVKGFSGRESGLDKLIELYGGNPLAIRTIATMIREVFNGDIINFLSQNTLVLGDRLRTLLKQHVNRLSNLEKELAYWLAIEGEPISFARLYEDLLLPYTRSQVLEALVSLERRSLLDKTTEESEVLFTLQPLVKKYTIEEFVARSLDEIDEVLETEDIQYFKVLKIHALAKNSDRVLVRFMKNLRTMFCCEDSEIAEELRDIWISLNNKDAKAIGYATENIEQILTKLDSKFIEDK
ncbi:NB-ARC domain-containing protein [Oscillatoriales cyanobacterium LEGE 11467]|uniref:NB-ARC domain-containing protein n=1 Tax=Zarconia navalis LEGE 11467 TaxID=1828826 RepID=A0A928VTA5_9CYAN|nr:NB-ARC domain-containing protein [Zarconia navalis]MBE9039964.1 NB-ARC domain-containing protein [Zarconia navalis LEGE 11467]